MPNIPPELMGMMQGGGMPGQPAPTPPVSSPMMTPQDNAGEKQGAMVQSQMAIDLLEQALMAFGSESEEGSAVLSALSTLSKSFGSKKEKARGLIPSEIMNLMSSLPQGAGAPPMAGGGAGGMPPSPMPPMPGAGAPPMM